MGMYTEIFFASEVDEHAYRILSSIIDEGTLQGDGHRFFDLNRAELVFCGSSAYFPGANHAKCEAGPSGDYYVSFRSNLKNYSGEIEAFFDWVKPHCLNTNFIGYSLYEEDKTPVLYYRRGRV